jgi:hypothetical protein
VAATATTSSATFIQMMELRSVRVMSCPTIKVPDRKAADAAPRIQPYSSGFPTKCGLAVLTVNASAIDVVGASAAAWTSAMSRTNQKVFIAKKVAAAAAAIAMDTARTRRREAIASASRPTNGPATRRTTSAAASIQPISCSVRPLLSKSFGQNGEATPKAPYRAT